MTQPTEPRVSRAHAGFVAFVLCSSALLTAPHALAEAAPATYRSGAYYAAHGTQIAALLTSSALLASTTASLGPGADPTWFPGDLSLRAHRNATAATISDGLLVTTLAVPVAFTLDDSSSARFVNTELVYLETLSVNLWLNSVVKVLAHRPRPYSYGARREGDSRADLNISFYSGHSSSAFAAATSGAYLFSESAHDQGSRVMLWTLEFMLAGATANLRTRAGKHYYSDVAVGALVGTGIGVAVPLLHGGTRRPEPSEIAGALLGTALGVTLTQLIPLPVDEPGAQGFRYSPLLAPHVLGLQALRTF